MIPPPPAGTPYSSPHSNPNNNTNDASASTSAAATPRMPASILCACHCHRSDPDTIFEAYICGIDLALSTAREDMHSLIRKGFQTWSYDNTSKSNEVVTEEEQAELAGYADEKMAKIVKRSLKCAMHAIWWGMRKLVEEKLPLQPPVPEFEWDRRTTKNGNGTRVRFDLSPISEGLGDISLEDSEPETFEAVAERTIKDSTVMETQKHEEGKSVQRGVESIEETSMEIDTEEQNEQRRKSKRDLEDFLDIMEETVRAKRSRRKK